ncbi:Phosphatidylinositol 4-kinase lsb6 [Psilocybe cubensis]|uniref:Phosphatidylinositol 4-kinase lsb6 n=2 Tax=Psilocybe cubensis TaxID=181762 RepID=A0ACB8HDX4_PSICU|nr:Phosphatidylinositol 4-kinase lsb6 [Psilocybe cubensis]KAH9485374.1 Phosphatidylinositol 4-kinase lsb6 [Psilocybe cubensis]
MSRSLRSAGYQPLQTHEDENSDNNEPLPPISHPGPSNTYPQRRTVRPGSIDLTKLDNAFKRWTESIAQKVKRKKKTTDHSRKQIWHSVFDPQVPPVPNSGFEKTLDHNQPMTQADFDALVHSVKEAIQEGIHPKMITKGSSGSYFARAKVDGRVQTVAVFKPKDEEPYGRLNPKTTKWLHRQFRWIIPFGRACLIPNLSYISEAAASLLDDRLQLHIVPPTQLVSFSSPAFFYDWFDRNAAKKGKQLPEKIGSLQYFLHGFQDASDFLRKYPWPGRAIADTFDDSTHRQGNMSKRFMSAMKVICGKTGDTEDIYDDADYEDERVLYDATEAADVQRPFYWSQQLQQSFREELEKPVMLDQKFRINTYGFATDYLMLNTDRGADNYMIKYCEGDHEKPLVDVAPSRSVRLEMPVMSELRRPDANSNSPRMTATSSYQPNLSPVPSGSNTPSSDYRRKPHIHIAAIDNSLSFPHEHPQGWRSYTYGWLYLPVSVIGRPFSEKTRSHFLPLLTSKTWWEETTFQLERLFAVDPDFHPKMFARQLAVIKGQAWNIVQSLKHKDEGPLELTRRTKVLVWNDEMEIPEETIHDMPNGPISPRLSTSIAPVPRRTRSQSSGGDFPPPMRRTSTDASGAPRPVPFAAKFQRVHPGTTGVTVLEHLERLDAVEASLQRLGVDEDEEVDVGEAAPQKPVATHSMTDPPTPVHGRIISPPPTSPLQSVPEASSARSSIDEEDLVALSKSTSHVEGSYPFGQQETLSSAGMEWMQSTDSPAKRVVISERLETVKSKPLCSCW